MSVLLLLCLALPAVAAPPAPDTAVGDDATSNLDSAAGAAPPAEPVPQAEAADAEANPTADAAATDPAPPKARAWLFMPAIEVGVLWHADPRVAPGPVFRTSLDYRFQRINAPFLRFAYDATTARMKSDTSDAPRLVANLALHDLLFGGGARYGSRVVQAVVSGTVGAQIAEVPVLREQPDETLLVDTETRFGGIATLGAGLEIYFSEDTALTFDLSGRAAFRALSPGASPLAGAFTVGLTTAL